MAKRNHSTRLVWPLLTLTMGALLLSPVAHAQAIGSNGKNLPAPSVTLDDMRQQVQALSARVNHLEEQVGQVFGDDKQSQAIEHRLAALEREQARLDSKESADHGAKTDNGTELLTTVIAPFEVVDLNGKTIVRIGATDNKNKTTRGILVYDDTQQPVAQLGVTHWGGLLSIINPKTGPNAPDVLLGISADGARLQFTRQREKAIRAG